MPTYEYKCEQCGKFEYQQSIKDDPLKECPTCGHAVKRLISNNVNIIFKGPGFYVTDNRSSSYREKASSEQGGSGNSSSDSGGSTSETSVSSSSGDGA